MISLGMLFYLFGLISLMFLVNSLLSMLISFEFLSLILFYLLYEYYLSMGVIEIIIYMMMIVMEALLGLVLLVLKVMLSGDDMFEMIDVV